MSLGNEFNKDPEGCGSCLFVLIGSIICIFLGATGAFNGCSHSSSSDSSTSGSNYDRPWKNRDNQYTNPNSIQPYNGTTGLTQEQWNKLLQDAAANDRPANISTRSSGTTPDDAYSDGYDEGYEQGRRDGANGHSHGYGYDDSSSYYDYYETKYQEGYEEGYNDGYSAGQSEYEEEQDEEDDW